MLSAAQQGLIDVQGKECLGAIDGGFTGWAVCGTKRLQTLRSAGAKLTPLPASNSLYQFGGGTARAVSSFDWTVKCGDREQRGTLDAVKGSLCLLLGRQFGADFGLSDDMANDEIRQKGKILPTVNIEGLKHIQVNCTRGAKSSSVQGESSQREGTAQGEPRAAQCREGSPVSRRKSGAKSSRMRKPTSS